MCEKCTSPPVLLKITSLKAYLALSCLEYIEKSDGGLSCLSSGIDVKSDVDFAQIVQNIKVLEKTSKMLKESPKKHF